MNYWEKERRMKQNAKKSRDNYNIELLRILACILVIGSHYCMNHRFLADGVSNNIATVLMDSFTHACPQVFFIITGFYMFGKDKTLPQVFKYIIVKILVPTYIVIFVANLLNDFVLGNASLWQCIVELRVDWNGFFHTVIHWANSGVNAFHLWFMFSLAQVYLLYPLLKLICKDDQSVNGIRRYVLIISILSLSVKPTIDAVLGTSIAFVPYIFLVWPVIYILLGYEIRQLYYKVLEPNQGRFIYWFSGLALFVAGCLLTFALSYYVDIGNNGEYSQIFLELHMFPLFIATIGLTLFGLSVHIPRGKIANAIQFIGSKTFVAYLLHVLIQRRLITLGLETKMAELCSNEYITAIVCVLIYFTLSVLVACIIDWLKWLYHIMVDEKSAELSMEN